MVPKAPSLENQADSRVFFAAPSFYLHPCSIVHARETDVKQYAFILSYMCKVQTASFTIYFLFQKIVMKVK